MEKILIVYESRYGATRQYAQAIGRALGYPVYPRKELPAGQLESCSILVYGGGLYAGGVAGIRTLKQAMENYPQKEFVLFTCGVADPALPETVAAIRRGLEKALGGSGPCPAAPVLPAGPAGLQPAEPYAPDDDGSAVPDAEAQGSPLPHRGGPPYPGYLRQPGGFC